MRKLAFGAGSLVKIMPGFEFSIDKQSAPILPGEPLPAERKSCTNPKTIVGR
jgi:hypothetical protein